MKANGLFWFFISALTAAGLLLPACNGDDHDSDDSDDKQGLWDGVCTAERDDWQKCADGRIQRCHVLEGMEPHFHEGLNCAALGLGCIEHLHRDGDHSHYEAFCVDETLACEEGEFSCLDNTARNCIDGVTALEPCGTKLCREDGDEALCENDGEQECGGHGHLHDGECHCDENYEIDPEDAGNCLPTLSFPEMACKLFADGADQIPEDHHLDAAAAKPGPHVHLEEVTALHLLAANASNYMHFPVLESGEYVMFLNTAQLVASFYDKNGDEIPFSNPGPNGKCAESLPDHFHISATYGGDGSEPEPVIVEFIVQNDVEVKTLIMFHEEDEHDH